MHNWWPRRKLRTREASARSIAISELQTTTPASALNTPAHSHTSSSLPLCRNYVVRGCVWCSGYVRACGACYTVARTSLRLLIAARMHLKRIYYIVIVYIIRCVFTRAVCGVGALLIHKQITRTRSLEHSYTRSSIKHRTRTTRITGSHKHNVDNWSKINPFISGVTNVFTNEKDSRIAGVVIVSGSRERLVVATVRRKVPPNALAIHGRTSCWNKPPTHLLLSPKRRTRTRACALSLRFASYNLS